MNKFIIALAMVAMPFSTFAQTAIPASVQTNIDRVTTINMQISALQKERDTVLSEITLSLRQGSQGDQVKIIQALLASDPSIYPEGIVSGFYGALTRKAVERFQEKNGFESVGSIGPKTRAKFNELLKLTPIMFGTASSTGTSTVITVKEKDEQKDNNRNSEKHLCVIVPPGHTIAPGWLKNNRGEDHEVIPPCQVLPGGIQKKLDDDNKKEHDDENENENEHENDHRQPDQTAPIISSVTATAATSSAVITWATNELSNSSVAFGTTTAYGATANDALWVNSHSVALAGLTPVTTYNYQVKSVDQAGNIATSTNLTFTTSAVADVVAPVISSIATSGISSTTAMVTWTTNEPATSKLYWSTTTPVNVTTAAVVSNPALVTAHSLSLIGLTASTTHYFLLNSIDAAGNSTNSIQQSFTTTQ